MSETPFDHRIEHDSLGEVRVPRTALYGAQTARAASWALSRQRMPAMLIRALGCIKAAAAQVNGAAGRLPAEVAEAVRRAADEVAGGAHADQFVIDVFQTGSGTSSNMNANEVIANRAAELLGAERGSRVVHPNDHVNLGQSSNDVVPSAAQLAAVASAERRLMPAVSALIARLHELADANWDHVRDGRTHLMQAMPVRFGQQFRGAAWQLDAQRARLVDAVESCRALPLGGTAVGTGVNAPAGFAGRVCSAIADDWSVQVHETERHLAGQSCLDGLVAVATSCAAFASTLFKFTNDLRWQASSSLGEIALPELQPGSSIMPGKINPVVCEAVLMACVQIQGNGSTVVFANSQGQFELNTMIPLIARNVLESLDLLSGACERLREHCLDGLRVVAAAASRVRENPVLATALAPEIGYDLAARIAKRAQQEQRTVLAVAQEMTDLSPELLEELLDPARLCGTEGRSR